MKARIIPSFTTLVIATCLSLGSLAVAAKEPHHGHAGPGAERAPMVRMLKGLDLTETQRAQIKQLVEQHKAQRPDPATMQQTHEQLQQLVKADQFDAKAVRQLLQKNQAQRLDAEVQQLQLMHDIRALLTPEQQAKLDERQAKRMEKRAERRQQPAE